MITETNCPICGANSFKDVYKAPYFRGDSELFQIQECQACQLWITNPRPADEDLSKYYETEDYISHTDTKKSLFDWVYHWVRSIAVKSKVELIDKYSDGKSLLDYGAGTGYFLNEAKKRSWLVSGVEPSDQARQVALDKNDIRLLTPEEFKVDKEQYSCITLWHVLEHLPNLKEHFQSFYESLEPNGILVIAVPNHESYDAKFYKESWAALDVPLHLYHFSKKNIKDLADQFAMDLVKVKNMPFDSFYVSLLSEKIKNKKGNPIRAIWKGLVSNFKGGRKKNASSLIYILRKTH